MSHRTKTYMPKKQPKQPLSLETVNNNRDKIDAFIRRVFPEDNTEHRLFRDLFENYDPEESPDIGLDESEVDVLLEAVAQYVINESEVPEQEKADAIAMRRIVYAKFATQKWQEDSADMCALARIVGYVPPFSTTMKFDSPEHLARVISAQPDPVQCYEQLLQAINDGDDTVNATAMLLAAAAPKITFTKAEEN